MGREMVVLVAEVVVVVVVFEVAVVFVLVLGGDEDRAKAFASAASFFVPAMLDRSPMRTASAPGQAWRAASARWELRACRMTAWPRWMSWRAARAPRPSAEPVMRMRVMGLDSSVDSTLCLSPVADCDSKRLDGLPLEVEGEVSSLRR